MRSAVSWSNFVDLVVPGERVRRHPRVVLDLVLERGAVRQPHGDLRGHAARVLRGVGGVRPCGHFREQRLDVRARDPGVSELSRQDVPVQQRHGEQVAQVVVRLFLRGHGRLRAVEPAAGEVVGDLRHLGADRDDRLLGSNPAATSRRGWFAAASSIMQ